MTIFWICVLSVAVAALQSLAFRFFNLRGVRYERRFDRMTAQEGDRVALIEVIRNKKLMPVPWIRVESRISSDLRFTGSRGEEREIDAERYHRSLFYLSPYTQITRRHEIVCEKRGFYQAGSVALTAGDLLGVAQRTRQLSIPCALTVYPRLLSDDELDAPAARWQGELPVRRWILPDPFLMAGIRDYRAGDPMRDVHWKASARTLQLQVKQFDPTVDPKVLVILNVQNSEEQWGELMDYEQEGIEHGIRVAATLCVRALSARLEAGFASNACLAGEKGTGKTIYLPARSDRGQGDALLGAMSRLLIHREATFPTFLMELSFVANSDVVVLSTYDSPAVSSALDGLRSRGNNVTMIPLKRGTRNAKAS